MADPADIGILAQGVAAVLTAAGSYLLGRYQARTSAHTQQREGDHKEREQLFAHYNELIQTTRAVSDTLRSEVQGVRDKMQALQLEHAKELAEARVDREECRVENERLKSEIKHLRADIAEMKEHLGPKG